MSSKIFDKIKDRLQTVTGLDEIRRENLRYLYEHIFGTQEILSLRIDHINLTQATISDILRGKRPLDNSEVRYIEEKIGIPDGWMDMDSFVSDAWDIIEEYQRMTSNSKSTFNKGVNFALMRKKNRC